MSEQINPPFDRTTCACEGCVACCKQQPGPLIPGDAERIAEHLGITLDEVKKFLWASPGALAKKGNQTFSIKTITPRMVKGKCVFLDENDQCNIHPVAPFGCAYVDVHQSKHEAMNRSMWGHSAIFKSDEYKQLRASLILATNYKPRAY